MRQRVMGNGEVEIEIGRRSALSVAWAIAFVGGIGALMAWGYQFGTVRGYARGYAQCMGEVDNDR